MTNTSQVLVTMPANGICLITLNRSQKRNALDSMIIHELTEILHDKAQDKEIALVLLNGNGEHFCAGADIAWMQKMAQSSFQDNVQDALQLANLLKTIYLFPKPIIGLIHGATMGGGLGIIANCDVVIAAENSVFCFSETKIGLTPSVISPYILPVIGERAAKYYYLTAEKFDVNRAIELNLVQKTVALEKLIPTGLTFAKDMLNNSPHALSEAKKLIHRVSPRNISDDMIHLTAEHLATMRASHDAEEGLRAFLEKRLPVWG